MHKRIFLDLIISISKLFVCFVCNRSDTLECQEGSKRGSHASPLCHITSVTAELFMVPVLDVFLTPLHVLKSQHVMRDTALEFGPPSGTGKLIQLLLDAGTSRCTRLPPPTDEILRTLGLSDKTSPGLPSLKPSSNSVLP